MGCASSATISATAAAKTIACLVISGPLPLPRRHLNGGDRLSLAMFGEARSSSGALMDRRRPLPNV